MLIQHLPNWDAQNQTKWNFFSKQFQMSSNDNPTSESLERSKTSCWSRHWSFKFAKGGFDVIPSRSVTATTDGRKQLRNL